MNVLIDSHVLLWLLYSPEFLSKDAGEALDGAHRVYVSSASLWELALKHARGKLPHATIELLEGAGMLGVQQLPVTGRHVVSLGAVALPHDDPFDALIAAQAVSEGYLLLTADRFLLASRLPTVPARKP